MHTWKTANYKLPHTLSTFGPSLSPYACFQKLVFYEGWASKLTIVKVSVKENEVPTEKNSSRASIFATKASYTSN